MAISIGTSLAMLIGLVWLSNHLVGPVVCRDGWASPSIGHRGACSWHGGVSHSRDMLFFPLFGLSAFVGWAVFKILAGRNKAEKPTAQAPKRDAPAARPIADVPEDYATRPLAAPNVRARRADKPRTAVKRGCPKCGGSMVFRTAKRGPRVGHSFYGCSRFPSCNGTRPSGR